MDVNDIDPERLYQAISEGVQRGVADVAYEIGLAPAGVHEAIATGIERGFTAMIRGGTAMPCADFYETIRQAAEAALGRQADAAAR